MAKKTKKTKARRRGARQLSDFAPLPDGTPLEAGFVPGPSPEETSDKLNEAAATKAKRDGAIAELGRGALASGAMPLGLGARVPHAPLAGGAAGAALRTEYVIRLLCAWTLGKPEQCDEVMQELAVVTVDQVLSLTTGEQKP